MVDLNHIILGSFTITNDNREVKSLGGMEVKFGVTKPINRVWPRYGNTHGDWVTGTTGTGTVLVFGTPRHTVYPYHGITGILRVYYNRVSINLLF